MRRRGPLDFWRLPAPSLSQVKRAGIAREISNVEVLREPDWRRARSGDPAAAIGIALRISRLAGPGDPRIDLAMSVLALCSEDPAARAVLEHVRRRLRPTRFTIPPQGEETKEIA